MHGRKGGRSGGFSSGGVEREGIKMFEIKRTRAKGRCKNVTRKWRLGNEKSLTLAYKRSGHEHLTWNYSFRSWLSKVTETSKTDIVIILSSTEKQVGSGQLSFAVGLNGGFCTA